ncbi:type II toxin-antitoxin system HicA family toxin [Halomonas sp. NO4]|uniref:type II toxin-antitoxin system HicA family toxin n=1 Tax=Halomonas sp. NO4 TaxID=2484813 RepID=UPI0013D4F2F5|nr:type II toxin-antitoxin system HicA family toxin [Halomonas sp. NO4]
MKTPSKRVKPLIDYAHRHGFEVSMTRKNHLKFRRPGYPTIFTSSTPSDNRTVKNTLSQLRRAQEGRPL